MLEVETGINARWCWGTVVSNALEVLVGSERVLIPLSSPSKGKYIHFL